MTQTRGPYTSEVQERIRKNITYVREAYGLTQAELAQRAGLPRTHVTQIESGKLPITLTSLTKVVSGGFQLDKTGPFLDIDFSAVLSLEELLKEREEKTRERIVSIFSAN